MITCPLCSKGVLQEIHVGAAATLAYLEIDELQDFYCPTILTLGDPPRQESHFHRRTFQGAYPEYSFLLPPFFLSWIAGKNILRIYNSLSRVEYQPWKYLDNVIYEDAIQWAKRLSNLKAFV